MTCFLGPIGKLVSAEHLWVYHLDGSIWPVLLPLLLDLVLLWAGATCLFVLGCRSASFGAILFPGIVVLLPCLLAMEAARLNSWRLPRHVGAATLLLAMMVWIAWARSWRSRPESLQRLREKTLAILGFGGVAAGLLMGEVLWFAWQARTLNQTRIALHMSPAQAGTPSGPRVIWILLDELSYEQVYGHRFTGLALPEFDRLSAQSTLFTNVIPAANFTDLAVPSMMTGVGAQEVRSSADGNRIELETGHGTGWVRVRAEDTVFEDALRAGYRTAVAGWYNPYCRLLGPVLDRCVWEYRGDLISGMNPHGGLLANMAGPIHALTDRLRSPGGQHGRHGALPRDLMPTRIADYRMLQADSDQMLADPSLTFLYLHLPVPHPPAFYERRTGQFTGHTGSYIDNLDLADKTLAHIRHKLEADGEWDSAAVLVMGDHSWRTSLLWRDDPSWTDEDEAASRGGQFDPRPAYILKLPHQHTPTHIDAPFSAVNTRALLDRILEGKLTSPDDVAGFAAAAH
ncbi:MAG: hypothetical protein NVSMB62_04690 [Acidobacteriaceae bacterium]